MRTPRFFLTLLSSIFVAHSAICQLDTIHYIPPFYGRADIEDHYLMLSTIETNPFTVTVVDGSGNTIATPSISKGSASKINLGVGVNATNVIPFDSVNNVNHEGLIASGSKQFFANVRHQHGNQGFSLTAKGNSALGTRFRSGHLFSNTNQSNRKAQVIGVIASQDNTNVTFSDWDDDGVEFEGVTDSTITVNLNTGESYVITAYFTTTDSNANNVNGTLITANRPIAVNTGSWLGGAASGNGRDAGFDQIVPIENLGNDYILTKRNSFEPENSERPIIVADFDNTLIYFNGDTIAFDSINGGDYFVIPDTFYDTNNTMYVQCSKKVYMYQTTNSSNAVNGHGLNFVPPLGCTAITEVEISEVDLLGNAGIDIITPSISTVMVNGGPALTGGVPVQGLPDWVIYKLSGLSGTQYIVADSAIFVSVLTVAGDRGSAGFFSGFGTPPFALEEGQQTVFLDVVDSVTGFLKYIEPEPYDGMQFELLNPGNGGNFSFGTSINDTVPFTYHINPLLDGSDTVDVRVSKAISCLASIITAIDILVFNSPVCGTESIPPIVACKDTVTQLEITGTVEIDSNFTDGGSADACGIKSFSINPSIFSCAELGDNTVTLTVTDSSNNTASCTSTVFVDDSINPCCTDPIALCQDLLLFLDTAAIINLNPADIDNGSTAECGVDTIFASESSFDCDDIGVHVVILSVVDSSQTTATCDANVTIQDVAPTADCQDISIDMDTSRVVSIDSNAIDGNSFDACEIMEFQMSDQVFSCNDLGANTITLTVIDSSLNSSTCTATVTLFDDSNYCCLSSPDSVNYKISDTEGGFMGVMVEKDLMGEDITDLGDINGDGFLDIAVGATKVDAIKVVGGKEKKIRDVGAVWIMFLDLEGNVIAHQKLSMDSGGLHPDSVDKKYVLGAAVAGLGDLNGDSIGDLAIGAPGMTAFDETGKKLTRAGGVYICLMNADGTIGSFKRITRGVNGLPATTPINKNFKFGTGLSGAGDINLDGIPDLAVGAPEDDNQGNGLKKSKSGGLWLIYLNSDGSANGFTRISSSTLPGDPIDKKELFGTDVSAISDYDLNGIPDIAVGGPGFRGIEPASGKSAQNMGRVHIINLESDGSVVGHFIFEADSQFINRKAKAKFGTGVEFLGDINDDGIGDLVIGAPGEDVIQKDAGLAYIVRLTAFGTVDSMSQISPITGLQKKDAYGTGTGAIGVPCYAVPVLGAPLDDDSDNGKSKDQGAVYLSFPSGLTGSSKRIQVENFESGIAIESIEIEENEKTSSQTQLSIFPNPNSGRFSLKLNVEEDGTIFISIHSQLGLLVEKIGSLNIEAGQFEQDFDFSNLAEGLYFVTVKLGDLEYSRKIIVMN